MKVKDFDHSAPILTVINGRQWESFNNFMLRLVENPKTVAALEVARLQPYIAAWSRQLAKDTAACYMTDEKRSRLTELIKPGNLSKLFNKIASYTGSLILSDFVVAPESLIHKLETNKGPMFRGTISYKGRTATMGFLQTFGPDKKTSISMPVMGLDDRMMSRIELFDPMSLLTEFQSVLTAGNHDVLHHYSNGLLGASISHARATPKNLKPDKALEDWSIRYFGIKDYPDESSTGSYEGWLVINHADIRRLMEENPLEAGKMERAIDRFFGELSRIRDEMLPCKGEDAARETVDYFGTMFCMALMRFVPFDHPFFERALDAFQGIDLWQERSMQEGLRQREKYVSMKGSFYTTAIANYAQAHPDTWLKEWDYKTIKMVQIIELSPAVANMMSPPPVSKLRQEWHDGATAHGKRPYVNHDLVLSVAESVWMNPVDGKQQRDAGDGSWEEISFKNGVPFAENDAPAYIKHNIDGTRIEAWFKDSKITRIDTIAGDGTRTGKLYKDGKPQDLSLPAKLWKWFGPDT